jgi:membrane protein required for colicin V production
MHSINTIDILCLIILGIFCIKGFFRGIIIEVFTLLGLLVAYIVAVREMSTIENWITQWIHIPPLVASTLAFLIIFLGIGFLFRWIAMLLRGMAKWTIIGWADKGGGFLFGLFKGALITSLVLLLISLIPFSRGFERESERSVLYKPLRSVAPAVFNFVIRTFPSAKDFYEEVKESLTDKTKEAADKVIRKQVDTLEKEIEERVTAD